MSNKIDATLMMGRDRIRAALTDKLTGLVEESMEDILRDLLRSRAENGGAAGEITAKLAFPILLIGESKVRIEAAIEWERKKKTKHESEPSQIDLLQTEIEFSQDQDD